MVAMQDGHGVGARAVVWCGVVWSDGGLGVGTVRIGLTRMHVP